MNFSSEWNYKGLTTIKATTYVCSSDVIFPCFLRLKEFNESVEKEEIKILKIKSQVLNADVINLVSKEFTLWMK